MLWLIASVIAFAILAFITWMFWEMAGNNFLPACFIRITGDARTDWIFAFVILNAYTASYYYRKIYKPGRL